MPHLFYRYAQTGTEDWPAQVQICGDPPGSSNCAKTKYSSEGPFLEPASVTYDGTTYTGAGRIRWNVEISRSSGLRVSGKLMQPRVDGKVAGATEQHRQPAAPHATPPSCCLAATYNFTVENAWIAPQDITYRCE